MTRLAQATVWITGASSGIGEAMAIAAAQRGARLLLSARREDELERVRAACAAPERHAVLPLDLGDADALGDVAARVWRDHGPIDVLVNNGGISQRSLCRDTTLAVYRRLFEVNVFGGIALTQGLLGPWLERRRGHAVFISSLVGHISTPLRSGYAASKHALHGYADALRLETAADGLRVTVICPGWIRTEVSRNALAGDGGAHGRLDPGIERGMPPAVFAARAWRAVERDAREVIIGGREVGAVHLHRLSPRLYDAMVRRARLT